uniref:ABC transporter domain-containing protein n=1 Tax=Heterorhabditis bacteriophora TaxID=37862 RepID=A0A1I7X947_HETBA
MLSIYVKIRPILDFTGLISGHCYGYWNANDVNNYGKKAFEDEVIQNCLKYVYLGCGIFTAATIQVNPFLILENISKEDDLEGIYTIFFSYGLHCIIFSILMATAATREAKKYAVAGGIAEEVLTSMRTVIAFNGQSFECNRKILISFFIKQIIRIKTRKTSIQKFSRNIIIKISLLYFVTGTIRYCFRDGCGKSTIIQLLLRYYNPGSGQLRLQITIDNIEIDKLNIEFLRNYIGVVSQEPMLFNTTIEQVRKIRRLNIRYGRENVSESEITAALRKANAYNFVKSFPDGIKTFVGDRGTQMSGGQKQRIAIARALVRDPKILLLDEATSALDAESEHVVQQALENVNLTKVFIKNFKASKGRTTIVIAHRLSTIRNADKIIAMKNGELSEINMTLSLKELEEEGAVKANLFKILRYAKPEWFFLIIAIISSIIQGCVFPAFSLFFSQIIEVKSILKILNRLTLKSFQTFSKAPGDPTLKSDGHFWALMFLVLGGVEAITMIVQCFFFGLSAERLTMRLRSKVFHNVMRMDATYFDMPRHSPGKISTRLATDTPNVKSAIDFRLGSVFNSVVSVCCGIGIAFYFGWQMAFITISRQQLVYYILKTIAIFPLAGVGQAIQMRYMSGRATQDSKEMENSGKIAMEAIENIRTVQALTLQTRLFDQFCHHLDGPHSTSRRKAIITNKKYLKPHNAYNRLTTDNDQQNYAKKMNKHSNKKLETTGFSYGFASSIFYFLYASAFRFGLWLIMNGTLEAMQVLRVLFAISFTAGSMGFASAYFPEYIKATFMLDEEPHIDGMTSRGKKPTIKGAVILNSVFFKYPERPNIPILQGLNVAVSICNSEFLKKIYLFITTYKCENL